MRRLVGETHMPPLMFRYAVAHGVAALTLVFLVSASDSVSAATPQSETGVSASQYPACQGCCQECGKKCHASDLKACTVMVPARVVETRVKTDVISQQEEREEKYTAFQLVPKTRKYEKEEWYLKQEVKSRPVTKETCHLVKMPVERTKYAKTYHPELREIRSPCGDGSSRTCEVMVETKEPRVEVCEETQLAIGKTEREMFYCVKTPEKRSIPCAEEKYYELVPVTKTRRVSVCVPKLVRTPYEVVVRKEIPQTIMCCPNCAQKHCK